MTLPDPPSIDPADAFVQLVEQGAQQLTCDTCGHALQAVTLHPNPEPPPGTGVWRCVPCGGVVDRHAVPAASVDAENATVATNPNKDPVP